MNRTYLSVIILLIISMNLYGSPRVNTQSGEKNYVELQDQSPIYSMPSDLSVPKEWEKYINPSYDEFWTEGNHRPDAGFLLFAKNPQSLDYAKLWLIRTEIKAQYLAVMMKTIDRAYKDLVLQGIIKDRYDIVQNVQNLPRLQEMTEKKGLKDLQYYFLFSPNCHYCQDLAQVLVRFPNVMPLQITADELHHWTGLPRSAVATAETIQTYAPDGVSPVLVIHNQKNNSIIKLTGNHSYEQILIASAKLISTEVKK